MFDRVGGRADGTNETTKAANHHLALPVPYIAGAPPAADKKKSPRAGTSKTGTSKRIGGTQKKKKGKRASKNRCMHPKGRNTPTVKQKTYVTHPPGLDSHRDSVSQNPLGDHMTPQPQRSTYHCSISPEY